MNLTSLSRCRGVLSHAGNRQFRSMASVLTRCPSRQQDHCGSLSLVSCRSRANVAFPTCGTNKYGTHKYGTNQYAGASGISEVGEKMDGISNYDSIEKKGDRSSLSPTKSKAEWSPAEVLEWLKKNGFSHTITTEDKMSGKAFGCASTIEDFLAMGFVKGDALNCRDLWNADETQKLEETTTVVSVTTPFDIPLHPFNTTADAMTTPQVKALGALTSISDFKEIRENGLYYVDKTKLVLDLVNKEVSKHVFLSRPRRFGKTLTVSVLENLFLGRKDLFTGLYAETNWDWTKKSPVLRFDLSGMNAKAFEPELHEMILRRSSSWSFQNQGRAIRSSLEDLVTHLYNTHGPCVILVDEYDKPVLDSFDLDPKDIEEVARHNRNILKSFFETIKSLGGMIRFSFVTGSSRLAKAAMFSGDNARKDISFEASYDAICGFTETELTPLLEQSKLELKDLQSMYDGYQFGGDSRVYNPFGVVNALAGGEIKPYWIQSGSLANSVLKFADPGEIFEFLLYLDKNQKMLTDEKEVIQNFDLEVLLRKEVPLVQLLLQAGYLTLSKENGIWSVLVPNDEVRTSAIPELLRLAITRLPNRNAIAASFSLAIHKKDMNLLYNEAHKFLAGIGFADLPNESFYRSILQAAFKVANGVDCQVECRSSCGRADLMLTTTSCRIIIELKLMDPDESKPTKIHKKASQALKQARGYAVGHQADVVAGWVVNKETRTLFDLQEYGEGCNQFEHLEKEDVVAEEITKVV